MAKKPLGQAAAERPEPGRELSEIELARIERAAEHARDQALSQIQAERTAADGERDFKQQMRASKRGELLQLLSSMERRLELAQAERLALLRKTTLATNNKLTREAWTAIAAIDAETNHHAERCGILREAIANLTEGN